VLTWEGSMLNDYEEKLLTNQGNFDHLVKLVTDDWQNLEIHNVEENLFRKVLKLGCSGRECRNPAGESPVTPIARFRRVAIPQFMMGNHMFIAWRKSPSCPKDSEL
ncbi:hypothetical protein LCGC14_2806960, partial [marine sediment metagenome]